MSKLCSSDQIKAVFIEYSNFEVWSLLVDLPVLAMAQKTAQMFAHFAMIHWYRMLT